MGPVGRWVTTTEAAQRLGVKRATLYAYVSRGLLHSERQPGQQESLFDRAEIDALASTSRASGSPQPLLRFRSVASSVSSQLDGDLLYRGVPLSRVVGELTFNEAVGLVLGQDANHGSRADADRADAELADAELADFNGRGRGPAGPRRVDTKSANDKPPVAETSADLARPDAEGELVIPGEVVSIIGRVPLTRRLPLAVQLLASLDPLTVDLDPGRATASAMRAVRWGVGMLGDPEVAAYSASTAGPIRADVPTLLLAALSGRWPSDADAELIRVLLTSLLDHGLTASTIAARVAASTRASLIDCLGAGYAALSGPLHGAAPVAARSLLDDPSPAAQAVANSLRSFGRVPGFGHFLYPDGDPRAEIVLDAIWSRRGTTRLRRRVDAIATAVARHSGELPNIDFASAAVLHALDLPAAAGEVVFQVARSYGIAAHVIEEYAEQPLRWRGREAVG